MRRYNFLQREEVYEALNRVRDAFLAAKDGEEVEQIINGLLTHDEKMKIGRRVLIARYVRDGLSFDEIAKSLKVGRNTIISVMRSLDNSSKWHELVEKRREKVEREYKDKVIRETGGSKLIFKKKEYSGFKRKYVKR